MDRVNHLVSAGIRLPVVLGPGSLAALLGVSTGQPQESYQGGRSERSADALVSADSRDRYLAP